VFPPGIEGGEGDSEEAALAAGYTPPAGVTTSLAVTTAPAAASPPGIEGGEEEGVEEMWVMLLACSWEAVATGTASSTLRPSAAGISNPAAGGVSAARRRWAVTVRTAVAAWGMLAAREGGGAVAESKADSAAGRRSPGMRMMLQRAALAPAAWQPALQNWAT
jgi:hypothetical protein